MRGGLEEAASEITFIYGRVFDTHIRVAIYDQPAFHELPVGGVMVVRISVRFP